MGRLYILAGGFLIGAGTASIVSAVSRFYSPMRGWGIASAIIAFLVLLGGAIVDDYAAPFLGISHPAYISLLVTIAVSIISGALIQWI